MNRSQVLSLYRNIIFCARRFPSIKRKELVEEIRIGGFLTAVRVHGVFLTACAS